MTALRINRNSRVASLHRREQAEQEARYLLSAVVTVNCFNETTRSYAVSLLYTLKKMGAVHSRTYHALSACLAEWDRAVRDAKDWNMPSPECDLNYAANHWRKVA